MNKYGDFIVTYMNKHFNYTNMDPDSIDIRDIAHALSLQVRFSGHTAKHWSVASHCILVSDILIAMNIKDPEIIAAGLLHDASECYCVDVPSPLKYSAGMEGYNLIEAKVQDTIEKHYKLTPGILNHPDVKLADAYALKLEAEIFFKDLSDWSNLKEVPKEVEENLPENTTLHMYITGMNQSPEFIEKLYINRFDPLMDQVKAKKNATI